MNQLKISLFAPLHIIVDDVPVSDFRTQKVVALLAYLATEPETPHRRETLMTLLWPGMPDSSARTNLRQVLFLLKKTFPDFVDGKTAVPLLIANRQTIQLNPAGSIFIDTVQFESLLSQTQSHDHHNLIACHTCHADLVKATALYTADFLADFYLEDSNEFEEWVEIRRQSYQRKMLDALETLTTIAMRQQAYAEARLYAERQLEIDDLRENAYQQLMEIMARNGQRNEALDVYEKCRRLFKEELGMAPANRTTKLYKQILAGDLRLDDPEEQGVRGYELQDEIGAGAYGVIHRAMQSSIGREVAVKVIRRRYANDPAFIRRFETEAQTIANLEHPHIVPLYDYWRDPDGAYLVMRLLRGGNLLNALSQGPWPVDRTQKLLDQISPALAAAHNQGIVHRDIKPANILFDESGNAYLSDFGIAKDLYNDSQLTIEGDILGTPDYISPEQLQEATVSPQSDIYSLGAVLYEMLTGEKPFPDVPLIKIFQSHLSTPFPLIRDTRPDLSPQIDAVIQKATAKRPSDRFPDALTFAKAFRQSVAGQFEPATIIDHVPIDADIANPYKGLRAFQEADALDFYGRNILTGQLVEQLNNGRFLAVVGPSGSGKSSVVKAGVIPALRQGAILGSDKWFVAEMVPGTHPLEELEQALWPIAVNPPPSLVEPMKRDPHGMLRTIRRILPNEEDAQLLLVIDQFEELWSLTSEDRRRHFLESLLAVLSAPNNPLHVIITLRADFYDRPLQYQPIADLFKQHTELVLPLTRDELTWAIQEPARRVGVEFDDTVLSAIVAEVVDQPGALPLLQYALTELFEARTGNQIKRKAFDEMEGVLGALPRRADEIYDSLSPAEKDVTRQFFLRLITLGDGVGDGLASPDTRRRVLLSELEGLNLEDAQDSNAQVPILDIINQFGSARLLTFDHDPLTRQPTVEVAHEALLREWTSLRDWLDESRDDVRLQRLLATAVSEWQLSEEKQGYLLRGARLNQYEDWATTTTVALTADEQSFLTASINARTQRQAEEAARQQRELETAQQLAKTEHQRAEEQVAAAQNLRRRATYLGAALVVAAVLAITALFAGFQANNNAETAVANANTAATQEALAIAAQTEALAQAEEAQKSANLAATAEANAEEERTLAQENEETAIAAQEEALAQADIARFNEAQAHSLALISSAREVRTGGDVDLALALAVQAVDMEKPPPEAVRTLSDLAFVPGSRFIHENESETWIGVLSTIPDGAPLISVSIRELTADVWANSSGDLLSQFSIANGDGKVTNPIIMPDSTRLTVGYTNGEVIVWDWSTGEKVQTLLGVDITNWAQNFAGPNGDSVVTIGHYGGPETEVDGLPEGFRMVAWDIESGEQIYRYDGVRGERMIHAVSTPDNKIALISTSLFDEQSDNTGLNRLLIVDLETGEILTELALAELDGNNYIEFLRINPAGDQAFAMITDIDNPDVATGVFISLPSGEVEATVALDKDVSYATYSPDGSQFVVDRFDGKGHFILLDAITGEEIRRLGSPTEGHTNGVIYSDMGAFTPDGNRLVSGGDAGEVLLWDVETGELLQRLLGHSGTHLTSVKMSPDGQTAITGGGNGRLHFWDISQGAAAQVFEEHQFQDLPHVTISPDGTQAVSIAWYSPNGEIDEAILWDTNTLEVIHRLPGTFITAHFLPDGRSVILGGIVDYIDFQSQLVHWDIESGEVLGRKMIPDSMFFYNLDVSPDGTSILFVDNTNVLHHYDIETLSRIKTISLANEAEWLYSVIYSPDGHSALVGGDTGDVVLLNLESGEEIQRFNHGGTATGLAFSEDGEQFVSVGGNQTIVLWDVASGEVIRTFNGHGGEVTRVAYTPDESQLISASGDGTLILWDVASGEALRTFSEHSARVNAVALSPDGQLAYSAADDGTVIVRPIAVLSVDEVLAHIADNRALHEFTCVEREQYRILPLCDADGVVPDSDN